MNPPNKTPDERAIERAVRIAKALWPEVADAAFLGMAFGLSESDALREIRAGTFGPYFEVAGRTYLRRDSVFDTLEAREVRP